MRAARAGRDHSSASLLHRRNAPRQQAFCSARSGRSNQQSSIAVLGRPSRFANRIVRAVENHSLTTRRKFICQSAIAAAAVIVPRAFANAMGGRARSTSPPLDPNSLARFVDPLPLPVIAQPQGDRAVPGKPRERLPFYRVSMSAIASKLHRDLPATRLWSYGGSVPGVMFETRSDEGLLVEWVNESAPQHFFPIDYSLHGAERANPEVRGVVHLHGAKAPPESDGYPEDWYVPGKSRTYFYPNRQDAAMLWYHDHAMGINRLNSYAGMFGLFMVRDAVEDALSLPKGAYEIPLV